MIRRKYKGRSASFKPDKETKKEYEKVIDRLEKKIQQLREQYRDFVGSSLKKEKLYREGVEWILRKQGFENKAKNLE